MTSDAGEILQLLSSNGSRGTRAWYDSPRRCEGTRWPSLLRGKLPGDAMLDEEHVAKMVVGTFRHNVAEGNRAYYEWVRTCFTVASGSLALLVSLKGGYLPDQAHGLWLLKGAWLSLSLTVITSIVILLGEVKTYNIAAAHALSQEFIAEVQSGSIVATGMRSASPPWYSRCAGKAMPWLFALSFALLAIFASINT